MLIDNILFLRDHFPVIREYFSKYEEDLNLEQFETLESRAGCETIRYQPNGEKPLMIHSMYDPIREAERIIASHKNKINGNTHVFFYGVGMGYHIERFIELYPNQSYSLYEPIPEIFFEMSKKRELQKIINKNMRSLYIDKHDDDTRSYLDEFNTSNQNIELVILPSYKNIAKEKYENFHRNIKGTVQNRRSNLHTDVRFQKRWVANSLINFETVLNTPNILRDIDRTQFEGKPAFIVSAGPSLAGDIEHIRYIKENNLAYIFSVGSAINSLIEYNVLPDAVFTYDPTKENQLIFEKMIERKIKHIPMVFGSSVGYETIEKYNGPKIHFITSQDRTSIYFLNEQLDLDEDLIIDSPSIAVMTLQILSKLGADPIIFAGQNLGYLDGRHYSEGIEYKHKKTTVDREKLKNALTTKDVYGNDIKTTVGFNNMRKGIEKYVEHYQGNTFINTTKGGANIHGVPFETIENVIGKVLTQPIDSVSWWNEENNYNKEDIDSQYKKLMNSIKEFNTVLSSLEQLMGSLSMSVKIKNESQILSNLKKYDNLSNKLMENVYYKNFLSFYIRVYVSIFSNEIKKMQRETDVVIKANGIEKGFRRFLSECKHGNRELNEIIFKTTKYKTINGG